MVKALEHTSRKIEILRVLENIFHKNVPAGMKSKDAVSKEIRNFVVVADEERCERLLKCVHSYWKNLNVKNGFLCVDDKVAIPKAMKDAMAAHAICYTTVVGE